MTLAEVSKNLLYQADCLPVLPSTLLQLKTDDISPEELCAIVLRDPFYALKVLVLLSKNHRQSQDVPTIQKCVMLLGLTKVVNLALDSCPAVCPEGLTTAIKRAQYSSKMAYRLSDERHDISPDEVQLSTLLADLGELILWVFNPEIPLYVKSEMNSGKYSRNQQAQFAVCGFKFKELSQLLAHELRLPTHVLEIIDSTAETRSQISRVCINISRHLFDPEGYRAIPDDIDALVQLTGDTKSELLAILELKSHLNAEQYQFVQSSPRVRHSI